MPDSFLAALEVSDRIVRDRSFGNHFDLDDADRIIASYLAHNAAVREAIPAARLLEFDVADGWAPLCAFLEVPIPDSPFPNVNDREQFRQLFGLNEPEREFSDARVDELQRTFRDVVNGQRTDQ